MWLLLSLAAALFQVLRNTTMKRLGHALDEYINVWGRFTFLLPFAFVACVVGGFPAVEPGFYGWCLAFGVTQTLATLALSRALKLSDISLVTALWKVSLLILLGMAWVTIGERPNALGVAGVLLSALGVYLLNIRRARVSPWAPLVVLVTDPGQRYTLLAAFFYAPSVITLKQASLTSDAAMGTLGCYLAASLIVTVLAPLGNVLGTGTQKRHGTVVANEGSTFVLRTDDHRTYRVDAASLDPQKVSALTPGQTISVTAHGGGQSGVLTATDVTPDAKGGGKTFRAVSGTIQEAGRQRVLFKTRDGLVLPVDVSNINGLPYLAPNQPATLYYEQGPRQEIVGVWISPGTAGASAPSTGAPSASAPSASVSAAAQSLEGSVESVGVSELKLQTSDGRSVVVDTSGVDRQALRAIGPGDAVTVTGKSGASPDRFVAQSVQPKR